MDRSEWYSRRPLQSVFTDWVITIPNRQDYFISFSLWEYALGIISPGNFLKCKSNDVNEEAQEPSLISNKSLVHMYAEPCVCDTCHDVRSYLRDLSREVQSGPVDPSETDSTSTNITQAENIQFVDGALSQTVEMGTFAAGDYDADNDNVGDLGKFLSRPVRIANITWPESTFTQTAIFPWTAYFNTAQIKKKLDNYARIRCKLKLKFVLNASPFYYGSIRACYFPISDERASYVNAVDQVPFSQTPGVYLEPQNMSTAEMTLPFLWPNNWLDATKILDFTNMGTLQLLQYANLRSANGVTGTGVNISVYAWAEDVTVMGPTTTLSLQSGPVDEYETSSGTISGPATAVANVASKLTDVPVIGTFARATEVGARAAASIARLFGFSNPPMIDDVCAYQPKAFHAMANVETRMPIDKLSLDPKNEVTINPQVAGIEEEDPLAFANLLTRESFLQGTLWSNSSTVDTLLWSCQVNPGYMLSGGGYFTTPPCSHFSTMFRYWRGSLVYKFRFIKTKYHKGRVLISWDPTGGNVASSDTETTTLTRIVDIETEDEIEFVVPYKHVAPYLSCVQQTGSLSNGAAPVYAFTPGVYNGALTIRVQNILTGPAANPQIDILSYVRCGEDFIFAVPKEIGETYTIADPTGVIQSGAVDDPEAIDKRIHDIDAQVSAITTGETVVSIRPLLHRSTLSTQQTVGNYNTVLSVANALSTGTNCYWRIPRGVGRDKYGYQNALISAASVPYSYCLNHPIDWTLNCFVGVRGSTNLHATLNNSVTAASSGGVVAPFSAQRLFSNPVRTSIGNRNGATSTYIAPGSNISRNANTTTSFWPNWSTLTTGGSLTNLATQATVSINVPQYENSRFKLAWRNARSLSMVTNADVYDEVCFNTQFRPSTTSWSEAAGWPTISVYYSAGVDFTPVFFLCTPRLFANTNPPVND